MIKSIPLAKLVSSPRNVRRSTDEEADLQLKADIEARGLLQNLVVRSVRKPRGGFSVEAGSRRLRALQSLADEGKLAATHEVCCFVIEGSPSDAQEASLAENFQRLAMNPADECLAFQQLIEQGADVEGIARRFGLTVRFVEGRLRLAGLAPVVFEALGAGDISLDVAKAYAATPDQERQAFVFEQMSRGYGYAHPDSIRRMMTQATASATDPRARFVGEDVYLAAGGRIERDLFADDAATRWLDVALLERLATEKMEALAAETAAGAGLAWVRPTLEGWVGYGLTEGLRRVPVERPAPTDEEASLVETLEAQVDAQVAILEDEDSDEAARAEAETKVGELNDRIAAILDKPPLVPDELKGRVGAFLLLDEQGRPRLDAARYAEMSEEEERVAAPSDAGTMPANDAGGKTRPGLSQRLVNELAMQRRDVLAVHIAADPALAFDLATFLMADRESGYRYEKTGSSLSAVPPSDPVTDFRTPDAKAAIATSGANDKLDRSWTEGKSLADRFDAFRALSIEARTAWLGDAVSRTLEASLNLAGPRACLFHDHLGQLLGVDVALWWRPTGANYFDRVPKAVALEALAEVGGPEFAALHSRSKKAELAQACERIFAGEFIGEPETKAAALAWVPDVMRFAPDIAPAGVEGEGDPASGDEREQADEAGAPEPQPLEIEEAA